MNHSQHHLLCVPVPVNPRFFLWSAGSAPVPRALAPLADLATPETLPIVGESLAPEKRRGLAVPLLDGIACLAALGRAEIDASPPSVAAWSLASKLALELVARERVVPLVQRFRGWPSEAWWGVSLSLPEDSSRVAALARAFPPAAHALPADGDDEGGAVVAPESLLRNFLDAAADALVRRAVDADRTGVLAPASKETLPWEDRFAAALSTRAATFDPAGFGERTLLDDLDSWVAPARGAAAGAPRTCVRLELPDVAATPSEFRLGYFLQDALDPSLVVPAETVWSGRGAARSAALFLRPVEAPEEHLLRSLVAASRIFPPIERSLAERRPTGVALVADEAWRFLDEAAPALAECGIGVILPAELTRAGRRRLRLRMRLGGSTPTAGVVAGAASLGLDQVIDFRWEAAMGGDALTARDLAELARLKAPLVQWRGEWVAVDPAELREAERLLSERGGRIGAAGALAAALSGSAPETSSILPVEVVAEGRLAALLERLRGGAGAPARSGAPRGLEGDLRAYQERGLAWLATMAGIGLGGCLADDMGLGKTIQVLAYFLARREEHPEDVRPSLIVCPTSVIGNWEREFARFAPSLRVARHYGADRSRSKRAFSTRKGGAPACVLTSYGLLRRDVETLRAVDWAAVILDEAQNVKNATSRTAAAARSLRASERFALTGTPVENRLAELWSILEFAAPGLLGPLAAFKRLFAVPIERFRDAAAAERLRRIVAPFVLRRLKSDPAIIQDLPPKNEMKVVCSMTREQASLYRAAVDAALRTIEESEGMKRRGLVLALITALKQICNHPAQYLGEKGPLDGRSGKLARLGEMLDEVAASGDSALVFTQYREMGDRLVAHLSRRLEIDVPFLHGGVPRARRDEMVRRFQEGSDRVFVLSVKAGGTGLNLTAANHVFHFDRWWNPAVEDQATDRAYRIGQTRAVQVHKLLTAGTVEERVDAMLEEKRDLASRIVGAGERWITEMDDAALRNLFALSSGAVVEEDEDENTPVGATAGRRGR